jgi:flagellar motor switch protein FliN/FliY
MEESIVSFFEQWIEEFARAVEMFTGERPTLSQKPVEKSQVEEWEAKRDEFQWWEQETEDPQRFKAWVGAEEACWTALAGSSGDGNEAKELFHEILSQANQGAAAVLSSSFVTPVKFGAGSATPPSPLQALRVVAVRVVFRDAPLPSLLVVLEPKAAKILDGPESGMAAGDLPVAQSANLASALRANSPMLDRLMDLHLPVSVLLGQTVMPIRDVLKITSGSLIELERQLGDYVEVMVHGTIVARGEIVSIKGNYGVRIKEVISRKDRFALKDAA